MKVLWLTNHVILPEHALALGEKPLPMCGWIPTLADALVRRGNIQLGIASNVSGNQWDQKNINNKVYFSVPAQYQKLNYRNLPLDLIRYYQQTVEEFKPDIIHIHGTEYFHGLLAGRKYIQTPTVISIQGLIDVCKNSYWGDIPFIDLIKSRTLRDWIRIDGLIEQKIKWHQRAKWEREIFAKNDQFIGRTQWDRAHTRRMNPNAHYYHCDELIRTPFYNARWNINNIEKHTIYASSASYPLKGFHVLISALEILIKEFPAAKVGCPLLNSYNEEKGMQHIWKRIRSNGYSKYLTDLIASKDLEKHIVPLGVLDSGEVAHELTKAHVYVLPSFIENSPNSLAEAMLVGTPSVVSFVGGIPSMVVNEKSALCFPAGDATILAEQIRRIFLDDNLANKLSSEARREALSRHSETKIVDQLLTIYRTILENYPIVK